MIALALLRFLRRTPWSTLMALIGVALGVTSIVSVHLISASVAQQLDRLIPDELAGFTHFLHRDDVTADHYFDLRRRWREDHGDHSFAGVTELAPMIDESMVLEGRMLRVIGIDLFNPGSSVRLRRDSTGAESFSWQGVWVDQAVGDVDGFAINGVLDGANGVIVADIGVAQQLLGWDAGQISYIGARLTDPLAGIKRYGENLLPGFAAGLPAGAEVLPGFIDYTVLSLAQQHPASQFGKSVLFNISALGLLAILVAWFLMYQVAVSWLRRLWPVFERLHVLGVDWRILGGYFVGAMCVLGLAACAVGLWAGQWLAGLLFDLVVGPSNPGFALSGWVFVKAFGSAVSVSLLGGLWAFRQALGDLHRSLHWGWAVLLVGMAMTGIWWPATGLLGGFTGIAVFSVLSALLCAPLLHYLRSKAALVRGPYLARLSLREAVWYPQDLAVALAGLTLSVATAIGVGLMIDSFREDFSRMLDRRLSYDLVVRGDDITLGKAASGLAGHPLVDRLQTYGEAQLRIGGAPMQLTATRIDRPEAARYGLQRALAADEALLSEQAARILELRVGQQYPVEGSVIRVAGVFASFGDLQPRVLVSDQHELAHLARRLASISIDSRNADELAAEILEAYPALSLEVQREIRRSALATFDQTFVITTVLILIALLVAAIGVYIAVTTLRLNRRTSARLMTGLGISRLEDVGLDLALGLGVGLVAMVLAVPLGTVFGWILCAVINPRAFGWTVEMHLAWQAYASPVAWGLLAAAAAGVVRIGRGETGGMRALD